MLKKTIILAFYFLICTSFFTKAQNKIIWGVETSPYISYSGLNWGLQINGLYKKHSLGIGTKVAFQSSYFPYKNTLGLMVDYKYFIVSAENIKSFISANYSNVQYEVKSRIKSSKNTIHEYVVSNGFLIKLLGNVWFGTSIGVGGYTERYYNLSESKKENYIGYNVILKGILSYEF